MALRQHYWEKRKLEALQMLFDEPRGLCVVDPGREGAAVLYPAAHLAELGRRHAAERKRLGFAPKGWPRPKSMVSLTNGAGNAAVARECAKLGISLVVMEQPFIPRPGGVGSVGASMRVASSAGVLLGQIVQELGDGATLDCVWVPAAAWQVILEAPGAKRKELKATAQERAGGVINIEAIPKKDREGLADALGMGAWWIRRMWWRDL